ncbi:MAG: plasmid pRiA4b ORF-3 family protein [Pseudonocardiaceae bacterium]
MAKTGRTRGKTDRRLKVIPGGAGSGGDELTELINQLAAAGVPDEVVQALQSGRDPAEVLGQLVDTGMLPSPEESFAGLLDAFAPLLEPGTDRLAAEMTGTEFLGLVRRLAEDEADLPEMLSVLIGQAEASGLPEALAMLRVLAVVGPEGTRPAAVEAADRIVASGLTDCSWVAGLGAPKIGRSFGYSDFVGEQESIALTFRYGRKEHAAVVLIDHVLGGGVKDCFVTEQARRIRTQFEVITGNAGCELVDYEPEHARLIMDGALSKPPCPVQPDQVEDVDSYLDLLQSRVALLADAGGKRGSRPRRDAVPKTVHRLKATLRGSKPPIWRRIEVPSTMTLQRLHETIQQAFGWYGYHLWVFETPFGEFGEPDPDLGHRSAAVGKLAQVASGPGDRIRYTYDFGDDWQHDILVEDVLPAEPGRAYPRCLTGRRARPPEDCGGMGGYEDLLATLADPGDDDHEAMLEWLGLDSPDEFDPAEFSQDDVNVALSGLAQVLIKR